MKKLFALSALVSMVLLSSEAFSEELNLSLSVEDVQPELTANYTAVNAVKGASIDAVIITATKGANLTWSVAPALISGLTSRISGDRFVISGAPAGGTKGTHAHTITAANTKGSATQTITITVSGQDVSEDLIASDGTYSGTPESPVTFTDSLGRSVTHTATVFTNSADGVILSADIAITTASSDFALTSGGLFSQTVSVDVTLAVYDSDYSEYIYSMDISGLPEWLTIAGDIADSHSIDSDSYHHEFTMSGKPSDSDIVTLIACVKISGDTPILAAFGSKDVTVTVNSPEQTPDPDPETQNRTLQALRVEIDGTSELETASGTPAASTFSAVVTGDYGGGYEAVSAGGYSLTWSMTPDGVKGIAFSEGTLSVGASADVGTYDFIVKADAVSGSVSASAQKNVKVVVNEPSVDDDESHDIAPVLAESVYSISDKPGQEVSIAVTATAGTNLTWTLTGDLPEGITGTPDENTYTLAGTLSLADAGRTYILTVKAANESGTADAEVSIRIQDIAPEISGTSGENITVVNGQAITPITFTASGTNIAWTSSGTLPNGLTGAGESGTFTISGTPSGNFAGDTFAYTVTAKNSAGSSSKAITFTVRASGSTPAEPDTPDTPDTPENLETITEYKLQPGDDISILAEMTNLETLDLTDAISVKSLDLTGSTSIKQIDLTGNTAIESLNLSGTNIEMLDAKGCENLESIILEDCESLEYVDVSMTKVKSLTLKNCVNLSVLLCESCDLQTLEIEDCRSLVDIDCRYNHLAKLDAASFTDLMRLECEHQTIHNFPASLSMNIQELFGYSSSGGVNASEVSTNMVKNLHAVDASGGAVSFEYDEMIGEIEFSALPAKFMYDYDTGFENILMDVTVFMSESAEPVNAKDPGSPGGCDVELNIASFIISAAAVIFVRRRKR